MRRWLALYALSITSIVVLAFLVPLAILIRDLTADRAMSAAESEAQTVARFAATVGDDPASIASLGAILASAPGTSVVLGDDTTIGSELPVGIDLTAARSRGQAYRQTLRAGRAVVVPVFRGGGAPWVIVIAVPAEVLAANVAAAWGVLGVLGIVLIGLAFIVADRMGRAVTRPIADLVKATHRLGAGELTVEVEPSGPRELAAVGSAFNTLTGRVSRLMDQERETAADLSHRLRTPLTALKLDVEALSKTVEVQRLQHDIDELERVVSHVIREARRPVGAAGSSVVDLAVIVRQRADYWGSLAADQDREWKLEVSPGRCLVHGGKQDFEAALDAVLGNIFAHTAPGTSYRVELVVSKRVAELRIADEGPGITDPSLLQRGASGGSSTGLGVDIVQRTAAAAGGEAHWEVARPSGTVVRLRLPLAATPVMR